jgi:hypothetical protein
MRDITNTNDLFGIIPEDDSDIMEFNAYYSTQGTIRGETLEDSKYKSSRLNIITASVLLSRASKFIDGFELCRPTSLPMLLRIFQTTRHIL